MRTLSLLVALPLCGSLLSANASAQSAKLAQAKAFRVEETLNGHAHLTVLVQRPDRVQVTLYNEGKGKLTGMFVDDGKSGHEFNGRDNTFVTLEKNAAGSYGTVLTDLGGVDVLLPGGALPARPGYDVGTEHEAYRGHDALVTSAISKPLKGSDGASYQIEFKLWSDPSTGLPLRRTQGTVSGGKSQVFQDLTFDDIVFEPKIEIAWTPPSGSKEDPGITFIPAGTLAPNFTLANDQGKPVSLANFRGKIVVLDFWATWCGPCQRAMPHLQQVYDKIKSKGVAVIGVCVWDKKPDYESWIKDHQSIYTFDFLFDPAGRGANSIASNLYGVKGIPTQYVIGKDGKILAGYIPGMGKGDPLVDTLRKVGVDIPASN